MKLRYLFCVVLILAVVSGCTGGEETAPETTAAPTEAPETQEVALHGVGKCDTCHDAPTMADMKTGKHKVAFEKMEGHKAFCESCHNVQEQCSKCHELPDIMK